MVLLPLAVAMAHRGQWLWTQPFKARGVVVPTLIVVSFFVASALSLGLWVWPRRWTLNTVAFAALTASTPYVVYCTWALEVFPFGVVRGTIVDLLLIPTLIAFSWGRVASIAVGD